MLPSRLAGPAKARKSLPRSEQDLIDIARLREETPEREALSELAGVVIAGSVAEAAVLRLIFVGGRRRRTG